MEQRDHPEGIGGLHPQTAERTAENPRDGGKAKEAGDHQPLPATPHTGGGICEFKGKNWSLTVSQVCLI